MEWKKIEVNSKILGHISAGIYRSPAGAIKELVSNAFDADATRVVITTNWPSFDIITCRDNGRGIREEKFYKIMTQEIGDSAKRAAVDDSVDDETNLGRPIIGWLGIGMLGIAQICHEFKVISHHRESKTAFRASVRLADFLREKVSHVPPDEISKHPIDVGEFTIETIEYDPDNAGTRVIAWDMRSAFIRKFRETVGENPVPLPSKFSAFLKEIHRSRSVKILSDYWQMIWELTLACPIPYAIPFDWNKIEVSDELQEWLNHLQKSLNAYQFEVVVDGLSLRKPHQYPLGAPQTPKQEITNGKLFFVNEDAKVYGQSLKLSGYIYLQNSRAVEPMELRGLLVRIRNIAIGTYDATLFKFPKIPAPRFNWVSGEIYVEEGLEFALNIDRDSFNELHPHFVKLKEIIHNVLENKVFPEAARAQRKRSQEKLEHIEREKEATLTSLINSELGDNYGRIFTDTEIFPLKIDSSEKIIVENNHSIFLPKFKSKRKVTRLIAYAFEIAMQAPEEERKEKFYQLLSDFIKSDLL